MIQSNKIFVWTQYKNKQNVSRGISGDLAGIIIISWSDKLCWRKHKSKTQAFEQRNSKRAQKLVTKHSIYVWCLTAEQHNQIKHMSLEKMACTKMIKAYKKKGAQTYGI